MTATSATTSLVRWAWDLQPDDVPDDVRHAAARHLLDGVGTGLAATRTGYRDLALTAADTLGRGDDASVLGTARRSSVAGAALANGILVHALDFDDTHPDALVHATAAVLPAAFAAGEAAGASGAEVVTAAVAGYETVIRLGAAVRHGFHRRGFHATSVCGVFAAALVAGRLSGLDEEAAVHALGIAGSLAAGSLEFLATPATTKQLHAGFAAQAGILAAALAGAGATGPDTILEGERGLFAAYADAEVGAATITAGLGERWLLRELVVKPYPVCQLSHASLDALRAIGDRLPPADDITELRFEVPHDAVPIVCEPAERKRRPTNGYEARFSLPWCAGAVVVGGDVTLDHLAEDRIDDPAVLAVADRVTTVPVDPGVAAADAPGRVTVRTRAGEELTGEVAASRGGARRPLTDDELVAKFVANHGDPAVARPLAERLLALDAAADVRTVLEPLRQELS